MRTFCNAFWIFLLINLSGCEKLDLKADVPECIEKEIKEFKKTPFACDSNARIFLYNFQNTQVFAFMPGNCGADLPIMIYDSNCNLICTLGGWEGNIMCNGEYFEINSSNRILIWEN